MGKDAIIKLLLRKGTLNLKKVVTATSRPKRLGEAGGVDYYFFSKEEFEQKIREGYFLEWAVLAGGRYFGTPLSEFDRIKEQGKNVILKIDVQGAAQVAKTRDDIVRIFIKPDSVANLKKRMVRAHFTEEEMDARLEDLKREMNEMRAYDYVVVNREGKLEETVYEVAEIIRKEIRNSNIS